MGFIGAGGIARAHVRRLLDVPEAEIVAFAEPSEASMARMIEDYPHVKDVPVFADYRQMLAEVEMDAVQIHTPHTLHFDQATDCLAAGKHVLLEKPMVCTVPRAHALIEAVGDRVLLISYQRHYQGPYIYIRDQIQSGVLGELQFVAAVQSQNWMNGTRGKWRQSLALSGGGQLNDSGSHLIDVLLWTTGLAAESVYADLARFDTEVDINTALTLRFTNGARGTLSVVGNSPMWWEEFSVWGSKGVLLYRNGTILQRAFDDPELRGMEMHVVDKELPASSTPDRNFVDAILGRDTVRVPPECGLRVIELTEAAWKSAELGRVVRVSELA
jgi:predicted dehydrogenase